ncbi:MAG: efflux RND transporter periplasmic adaptor subunit, partial [Proteobacteria bacterium]|nr:efflux RND transporter periplasmic adaptor subunit [Pseudomonadota bacterium]
MKKGLNIILIIILLLLVGAGGYFFGKRKNRTTMQEMTTTRQEKKVKYWVAPMDPTYIRNEPGKSPMGMDLIPAYEDDEEESAEGAIKIDPVTVQNIGVRTALVQQRSLSREIRTVGVVAYDEKRVTQVQSKVEGWIEKLYIDFTGQSVKKDDILLEIYSPQLVST